MAVSWLAWVPFYLDDARLAARIADTLRPYRDYWAHPYSTVLGPVTMYLAMCAATTGDGAISAARTARAAARGTSGLRIAPAWPGATPRATAASGSGCRRVSRAELPQLSVAVSTR